MSELYRLPIDQRQRFFDFPNEGEPRELSSSSQNIWQVACPTAYGMNQHNLPRIKVLSPRLSLRTLRLCGFSQLLSPVEPTLY